MVSCRQAKAVLERRNQKQGAVPDIEVMMAGGTVRVR